MPRLPIFISILLLWAFEALAADPCFYGLCRKDPEADQSVIGGSLPSYIDSYNLNPASIPVTPTPFGLEFVESSSGANTSKWNSNLGFVKGLRGIGAAISNVSDNSFYSYNLVQASRGGAAALNAANAYAAGQAVSAVSTVRESVNFGSALALPLFGLRKYFAPNVGLNLKLDEKTGLLNTGWGFAFDTKFVSVGLGSSGNNVPAGTIGTKTTTTSLDVAFKVPHFNADFTELFYGTSATAIQNLPPFKTPVRIYTAGLEFVGVSFTSAYRKAAGIDGQAVQDFLLSLQVQIAKHFSGTFIHNYIPGSNSLALSATL